MDAAAAVAGVRTIQGAFSVLSALGLFAEFWPKNANVPDGSRFDFVIVGAGTAGCVVANRLTELPHVKVLVIEAGGDPTVEAIRPGLFAFLKQTKADWNYKSEDNGYQFHKNHVVDITRGKMLGGSSSINFMAYTRGNFHDYNTWAQITGDPSWSWKNVLPYFKKSEKMLSGSILKSGYKEFHGTNGLMKVTKIDRNDLIDGYLQAFEEIGHKLVEDTNGDDPLGYTTSSINMSEGKRQGTAYSFLSKAKDRPNLYVLKNALATKLIIDDKNIVEGVEVSINDKTTIRVYADKEVIVSTGSINSPQLLLLSGIGPKNHLEELDINVKADLPVGQSLTDHVLLIVVHKMGPIKPQPASLNPEEYPLPLVEGYVALNKSQKYPDYQSFSYMGQDPQMLMQFCSFYYHFIDDLCQEYYDMVVGHEYLFSMLTLINPRSRGQVLLKSSDAKDSPRIYTGYYSDNQDLEDHAIYLQDFLKVSNSDYFKSFDAELLVPKICGCSRSDSDFYKCYALCLMLTGYHFTGSVPMGAVLDSRLRVHGVEKLRVVDASVMPKIPSANTHAPTIMVGERAADMIKKDHGLNEKCDR